jgi:hypothetical protein
MRKSCSNWCNIRGAGIGQRPTTETGKSVSWGWIDWLMDGWVDYRPLLFFIWRPTTNTTIGRST